MTLELDSMFPQTGGDCGKPLARIFGVRHLSSAAAYHLEQVLDAMQPTAVLIEGPADATDQIKHLAHQQTEPPVALLAYTQDRPIRSILYPLAGYSPEWIALTWAVRHKAEVRFIDLPAAVFLALHEKASSEAEDGPDTPHDKSGQPRATEHTQAYLNDPWEAIARLSGDPDHETWWERRFEHTTDPAAYVLQIFEFGRGLRELDDRANSPENLIREAHMRRCIHQTLAAGRKAEQILVVCGAFHAPALTADLPPMTDQEEKSLPRAASRLTLMPYSYYRLSSQSGYGAGNHAPAYYQRLFEERRQGESERVGTRFLAELAAHMRQAGQIRSAAEVIEAVRLARSLACLAEASAPCLRDLRDAAVTCLGRGESAAVKPFLAEVEVGRRIGRLPKGVSRTSIQDDFYELMEELKLEKFQVDKEQELELDLRENRFVKTTEAAFRDLRRSTFLHRLHILDVAFGKMASREQAGTAREKWRLRWQPDCEIQLVEASLKGDTVEMAAAVRLSERLAECERIDQAAALVKEAADCQLVDALEDARRRLQTLAVEDSAFDLLASALYHLAETINYGSVRKMDPAPLRPLLTQLFLRASLQVRQACLCDDAAAKTKIQPAINILNRTASESANDVDAERWNHEIGLVAAADNLNPYLSGFACALLLEKGLISEEELAREVSRRLSPGVHAELGAGWFEGLVQHNRQALFSRLALWRQLDAYLVGLEEPDFLGALVYLRRAFGNFSPGEVRRVVSNLVEVSSESAEQLKAAVDVRLDDEEAQKLQELLGGLEI